MLKRHLQYESCAWTAAASKSVVQLAGFPKAHSALPGHIQQEIASAGQL